MTYTSSRDAKSAKQIGTKKLNSSGVKKPEFQGSQVEYGAYDGRKRSSAYERDLEEGQKRGRSKSMDRSSTGRPRSANRERSRDYASTYSHYSNVYSRILNSTEANKIKKLVGEYNADLDVVLYNKRASS